MVTVSVVQNDSLLVAEEKRPDDWENESGVRSQVARESPSSPETKGLELRAEEGISTTLFIQCDQIERQIWQFFYKSCPNILWL